MLKDFVRLVATRSLFTFAVQMQAVIVGIQVYELTRDPLALGLIGLAEAVPALSLALYAGYLVDRGNPVYIYRRVLLVSLTSGLTLLAAQVFASGHAAQVAALYGASFITGVARAFSQPSMYAIVPRIVPRETLTRASAWMSSTMQVARIAGPALGGLVYGFLGMRSAVATVCAVLALASLCMRRVTPLSREARRPGTGRAASVWKELFSGMSFVWGHSILLSALSLDMISVLFGGATAIIPVFVREVLGADAKVVGLLRAAPAIGATLTSIVLTRVTLSAQAGRLLLAAVVGFGLSIGLFALSRDVALSALALGLSGAFDSVSMVIRSAIVQLASPADMRGRISAVNSMFIGSSNEIGEFESGVAAKVLGTVPSVVFGAGMCLLTVALVSWRAPALRRLDLSKL
jgi:MFS family permease